MVICRPNIKNIKVELARNDLNITSLAKTIGYDVSYINLVVNGKKILDLKPLLP